MEVKFLLAGYGLTVSGRWVKDPLLDGCDDGFIDSVTQTACHFDVGDPAGGIDHDVEDDVAFGALREYGEVRVWGWKVAGESDVDVTGA